MFERERIASRRGLSGKKVARGLSSADNLIYVHRGQGKKNCIATRAFYFKRSRGGGGFCYERGVLDGRLWDILFYSGGLQQQAGGDGFLIDPAIGC